MKRFYLPLLIVIFITGSVFAFSDSFNGAGNTAFIENRGQWDSRVLFLGKTASQNIWVTKSGIIYDHYILDIKKTEPKLPSLYDDISYDVRGHAVAFNWESEISNSLVTTSAPEPYKLNYFLGNDHKKWQQNVELYKDVVLKDIYSGVDMRLYFENNYMRYDYHIREGSDPSGIIIKIDGADSYQVNKSGELVIGTSLGEVTHQKLFAFQYDDKNQRIPVECSFKIENSSIKFEIGNYDRSKELIIDPLVYSTYIAGSSNEEIRDIEVMPNGDILFLGITQSSDMPTTTGAYKSSAAGGTDIIYGVLTPGKNGSNDMKYMTYLGGSSNDEAYDIDLDSDGNIYLAGWSQSNNYPTTSGAYQPNYYMLDEIIISKFSPTGTLEFSTYIIGEKYERANAIAIDESGTEPAVIVTGYTRSDEFTTTKFAFQGGLVNSADAFVLKLTCTNSGIDDIIYGTYLGGQIDEVGFAVDVDAQGNIYAAGYTSSPDFPITAGAFDEAAPQGNRTKIFIFKLEPVGGDETDMMYSTFVGGSDNDFASELQLDADGYVCVSGYTNSSNFPVSANAYDNTYNGNDDAIFFRLDAAGNGSADLLYSTFLGGPNNERANAMNISDGNCYIAGFTESQDYPTTSASEYPAFIGGTIDCFVSKINLTSGSETLTYSSFYGGIDDDQAFAVKFAQSNLYLAGITDSSAFPVVWNAFDTKGNNGTSTGQSKNGFITILNIDNPPITFSLDDIHTCKDASVQIGFSNPSSQISGGSGDYSFKWEPADNLDDAASANPTYLNPAADDEIYVEVTDTQTGLVSYGKVKIIVEDIPTPKITDYEDNVCVSSDNSVVYSAAPAQSGTSYEWSVINGTMSGSNDGDTFEVIWSVTGTGKVILRQYTTGSGCEGYDSLDIIINPLPDAEILGPNSSCANCTDTYNVSDEQDTEISWTIIGGTTNDDLTGSSIDVKWDAEGTGRIKVIKTNTITGCVDSAELEVEVTSLPKPAITGKSAVCEEDTETYTTRSEDVENTWYVTGGTIINNSGSTVDIQWTTPGDGNIKLVQRIISVDITDSVEKTVTVNPLPNPNISGKNNVLTASAETYKTAIQSGVSNTWTVSGGTIVSDNGDSITVEWGVPGSGTIELTQTTAAGCSKTVTLDITINSLELTIIGNDEVCFESTELYSTPEISGTTLMWTISGGSILTDPTATEVDVEWTGTGSGTLTLEQTVTVTGAKNTVDMNVTINPLPQKPLITRDNDDLLSSSATGNQWYKDGLPISGANSQRYTPDEYTTYSVKVTDQNGCENESDDYDFQEIAASALLSLYSSKLTAAPGDLVTLQIVLRHSQQLDMTSATGISADLTLAADILVPVNATDKGTVVGTTRTIPLNIPKVPVSDSTLLSIDFIAALGENSATDVSLNNLQPVGGPISLSSVETEFLLEVCEAGGSRLVNSAGTVTLYSVNPNPVRDNAEIKISTIEQGTTMLYVVNSLGNTVSILHQGELTSGEHKFALDTENLSSGTYLVILQTETVNKSVIISIIK